MFGNPETTPGGKALKFYSSVRLDIRRIAQIKKGEEVVGGRVRVKVVKNKVAAPFRVAEFDILYNEGISPEGEVLALGEQHKVLTKSGAAYSWKPTDGEEVKLGRGYDNARTFLRENPKILKAILKEVQERLSRADQTANPAGGDESETEE
jgi:recombination protein RecA